MLACVGDINFSPRCLSFLCMQLQFGPFYRVLKNFGGWGLPSCVESNDLLVIL